MSDSIQKNDEQASNQALSPNSETQRLRLVRSSSASSSSSFDSCSDLLGSFENTDENLDEFSKFPHTERKDNEHFCGAKDDVTSHQTSLHSKSVLGSAALRQCECIMKEQVVLHPEVKDQGVKMESTSVKDHVYGLSNAISFNTVRFLAENTVERISQLQTSFRMPTSYIFPLKNVLQTENTPDSHVQTGISDVLKVHTVEKVSEAADDMLNNERNISMETNSLLSNQPDDVVAMPHKDVDCKNSKLDDVHTKGLPTGEKSGAWEQGINTLSKENTLENLDICGTSAPTKDDGQISDESTENTSENLDICGTSAPTKDDGQISDESTENAVPCVVDNNTNCLATADALSRGSEFEKSKHSDLDIAAMSEGLRFPIKKGSGSESLQMSTASSDCHTKSSAFCHPLRTLSSGSGRPDLEEVDVEENAAGRVLLKKPLVHLFDTAWISADNVESHVKVNNEAYMHKDIAFDHDAYFSRVNESSCVENAGSSPWSCTNQGRELTWCDQPILAEAVDRVNSECRQGLSLDEQAFGDILHEERWKGLSIRLQSKLQSDQREQKDSLGPDELCRYVENLELNETYVDTVLDMEDVLLNYDENGNRERFLLASSSSVIGTPRSSRDGSLSSSTSGLHSSTLSESAPFTVDWVEVVGAKQRRGGSSFGERIVGVKDHTVYCIKVSSGNQEWEVLRRYRDFVDLYHQLRRKFNVRTEKFLPSPWKEVDRDSRKVFGSTHPNVVEVRSSRIEKCLQSLLQAGPPFSTCSPLCWFLGPQSSIRGFFPYESFTSAAPLQKGQDVQLGSIESPHLQSPRSEVGSYKGEVDHDKSPVSLGKTVKLDLKTHPNKNMKQLLSSQHHSCAGCYKHLEADKGLVHGFVQTLGWGKPRLCEYSGQLYCTSCHLNETAVLPAQVLWHWDFTPRRVSQLAKAYLDSIYDQPMLCVSAVNPYLYSRVPILSHVKETRRKLSKMLACMRCSFRTRILQTMGSRRYLMENNDFFALRDLEDLSKGAFAVLPSLLKAVLGNLRAHITKQCSVCSETGEWCGAGVLCEEPFSPIFPFEEENITNCKVCHAPFHPACFSKFATCPACTDDQSNKSMLAGVPEHPQTRDLAENHRDVTLLLGGEEEITFSGGADLQGGFELDRQSQTRKNWPSFYSLLPKPRLW